MYSIQVETIKRANAAVSHLHTIPHVSETFTSVHSWTSAIMDASIASATASQASASHLATKPSTQSMGRDPFTPSTIVLAV